MGAPKLVQAKRVELYCVGVQGISFSPMQGLCLGFGCDDLLCEVLQAAIQGTPSSSGLSDLVMVQHLGLLRPAAARYPFVNQGELLRNEALRTLGTETLRRGTHPLRRCPGVELAADRGFKDSTAKSVSGFIFYTKLPMLCKRQTFRGAVSPLLAVCGFHYCHSHLQKEPSNLPSLCSNHCYLIPQLPV